MKRLARFAAATLLALGFTQAKAAERVEIQWWIGLTGIAQDLQLKFAEDFNASQDKYKVVATFKGQYPEQRAAAIAAFRAGKPPHIIQMFDAGSGDMMAARGAIKPVADVFATAGLTFEGKAFLPPAASYYSTGDGRLLSMPFNVSTAVMFYNKDAFRKAGLDADKPPRTWPETIDAAKKLRASGMECGFTTTWLAWVMLEQFSAVHDLPIATRANGLEGADAVLNFNTPGHIHMVQTLVDAQKDKSFDYGGRSNDAAAKFESGACGMLMQSSGGLGTILRNAKFQAGAAPLPYWPDLIQTPKNSIIGGASNWVFNGFDSTTYRGIAEFLTFLAKTENAARFSAETGFLPATVAAFEQLKADGLYSREPIREVAVRSLMQAEPGVNSKGYRFGRWVEIRDVYHEEVERALQGQQTAEAAIAHSVERGNVLLRQFERMATAH